MQDGHASSASLEDDFVTAEESIENVVNRLKAAQTALVAAKKAVKIGDVTALAKALNQSKAAIREAEPALETASRIAAHDYSVVIRSNDFAHEVIATAKAAKLEGVRMVHGTIFSFPVIVAPVAEKVGYRIGKKLTRSLRPSAVVGALRALRERRPNRRHLERLLAAISQAYLDATRGEDAIAVRIGEIYQRLVPLGDQKTDYTELDFVGDLYLLERENVLALDERVISFPASTGVRSGNVVRISTESGDERVYSSIRFD